MEAVNTCNLQLVNGFLADPKGMKVFYLCLPMESLLECQALLQLQSACPCVIYCQGYPGLKLAVSYSKPLRGSSISLYHVYQQSFCYLF